VLSLLPAPLLAPLAEPLPTAPPLPDPLLLAKMEGAVKLFEPPVELEP
jgi:hypothetical protein